MHIQKPLVINVEENSFGLEDIRSQAKKVISIIIKSNKLTQRKKTLLLELQEAVLSNHKIEVLNDRSDAVYWVKLMELDKNTNHTWLNSFHHGLRISYFHRLILDKLDYFTSHIDPYKKLKQQSFQMIVQYESHDYCLSELQVLLSHMLWSNKFDLVPEVISEERVLITDHTKEIINFISKKRPQNIDIIADNSGKELYYDLVFMDLLLRNNYSNKFVYHVKNYPYNITDTTIEDVMWAVTYLKESKITYHRNLGKRIENFMNCKRLILTTYPYSTLGFDQELSWGGINNLFEKTDLLITKGDFNYRKVVGWFYWTSQHKLEDVLGYLNVPILIIRTVKNEVLLGVENTPNLKQLETNTKDWWKKGIGGMIVLSLPSKSKRALDTRVLDHYWGASNEQ